jgi:hypothetical protein
MQEEGVFKDEEWVHVFQLTGYGGRVQHDISEVDAVAFVPLDEVRAALCLWQEASESFGSGTWAGKCKVGVTLESFDTVELRCMLLTTQPRCKGKHLSGQ